VLRTNRTELRRRASTLKPLIIVGKGGVTDGIIRELDRQLEEKELVKIRFLRSSNTSQIGEMIARLAKETQSELVETRGNTATLYRPLSESSGKIYKGREGL